MKIDRHSPSSFISTVKLGSALAYRSIATAGILFGLLAQNEVSAQLQNAEPTALAAARDGVAVPSAKPDANAVGSPAPQSQPQAVVLLRHTIDRLANGPAFNAKVRQRVWAVGREVVGVGTYEQAGYGSGRFNLQLTMHDGGGKHTLQQISDGRLAWTRTMIADKVSLRRVDVGRLDEWIPAKAHSSGAHSAGTHRLQNATPQNVVSPPRNVPPRLKVGAWTELLDMIERDHVLRLGSSKIESRPVLVITGSLKNKTRLDILATADQTWPQMYPSTVKVAIATDPDPETGFGEGLPLRFEFWSDPSGESAEKHSGTSLKPRLVALIELYSLHPMTAPPVERFRFENQDADVNFVNETDRYLQRYGVRITDSQRRLLMR